VHGGLLLLLSKEEEIFDQYAGQPYLCDFGVKGRWTSEKGKGPGGTEVTGQRLYKFGDWSNRLFTRDALKALFPEKADTIDTVVDPGEYGSETWFGRVLCCFLLITSLNAELDLCYNFIRLLWNAPDGSVNWIAMKEDRHTLGKSAKYWLDHVKVQVGGMTRAWKVINFFVILIPKFTLWCLTAETGVTFLMETATINDVIVNACALAFLLSLDNMILETFVSAEIRCLMDKCEPLSVEEPNGMWCVEAPEMSMEEFNTLESEIAEKEGSKTHDELVLQDYVERQHKRSYWFTFLRTLIPLKFLRVCLCTVFFVAQYYIKDCVLEDGQWVSKPLRLPVEESYGPLNFVVPPELQEETFWSMPK